MALECGGGASPGALESEGITRGYGEWGHLQMGIGEWRHLQVALESVGIYRWL